MVETVVSRVTLPGMQAPFTVLPGHAAIVTALVQGKVRYIAGGKEEFLPIKEGFAQVRDNVVKVCVEV